MTERLRSIPVITGHYRRTPLPAVLLSAVSAGHGPLRSESG